MTIFKSNLYKTKSELKFTLTQTEFQDKSRTFSTILFKLKDMKDPEISMSYEMTNWLKRLFLE